MSSPHLPADSMPTAGTNGLASTADAIELVLCAEASDLIDSGEWLSVAATSAAAPAAAVAECAAAGPAACLGVPATHTWPVRLPQMNGSTYLHVSQTHEVSGPCELSVRSGGWARTACLILPTGGSAQQGQHGAHAHAGRQPRSAAPSQAARRSAGAQPGVTGAASSAAGSSALAGGHGAPLAGSAIAIWPQTQAHGPFPRYRLRRLPAGLSCCCAAAAAARAAGAAAAAGRRTRG